MKILHVITGLDVGGAETMLARLMECGNRHPDLQSQIVSLMPPGPVGRRIAATGAPVSHLGMTSIVPSIETLRQLVSTTRRARPDLIIGWMHHGQLAASLAALAAPGWPPVMWNVRHSLSGYAREKATSRAVIRAAALLSRHPRAIVYNSDVARRQYRAFGYHAGRDLVIPNGFERRSSTNRAAARVELERRFAIPKEALVIGMVARNHPMKDVPNLLAAFRIVRACRPDAHLLLVGDGMDRPAPAARALLDRLPAGSWTLAGHSEDISNWLPGLDIGALPSAWGEGFSNFLGEAMSGGVPCVTTDVGDARSIVAATGRTVPPEHCEALAAALLDLCAMGAGGRIALGHSAAARIADRYSIDAIADRYAALYREHAPARSNRAGSPLAAGGAA